METSYDIRGMTCAHCAHAVTEELSAIDGVTAVAVDVAAGTATITSDATLSVDVVAGAVEEAGYALAHPRQLPLL
jgi:copper chaperone CopZ